MSAGPTKTPHVLVMQPFGHPFKRTGRIILHLSKRICKHFKDGKYLKLSTLLTSDRIFASHS